MVVVQCTSTTAASKRDHIQTLVRYCTAAAADDFRSRVMLRLRPVLLFERPRKPRDFTDDDDDDDSDDDDALRSFRLLLFSLQSACALASRRF